MINLSLAFTEKELDHESKSFLRIAVKYAEFKNVIVVCASGNEAKKGNPKEYPACFPEVFSVGAIEVDPEKSKIRCSEFSNYNSEVDFCSDGEGIYSLSLNNGYECYNGTSLAAPHVSGYCALIKEFLLRKKASVKINEIKKIMKSENFVIDLYQKDCEKLKKGRDDYSGFGFCTLYAQKGGLEKMFNDLKEKLKL